MTTLQRRGHRRFRGSVVRSRWSKGPFWHSLDADEREIRLRRGPFRPMVISRTATTLVRFERVSLPLWWTTQVTFDTKGAGRGYVFNPARPRRLSACLRELGWPVTGDP
jgi:hypothetical protein